MLRSIGPSFLLLAVLAGCGVDSKKATPTQYTDFIPQTAPGETREFAQSLDELQTRITLDEKAPEGLGLVLAQRETGVSMCTTFMLTDVLALTNARCVPELKTNDCSEALGIVIKTRKGQEVRRCKKVGVQARVRSSSLSDPDYAVIELSAPVLGLQGAKPSRDGIRDGEDLTVESINPVLGIDGRLRGEFKKSSCRAYSDSLIGNFSDRRSSVIPIFPREEVANLCALVAGSSGAAIKNQLGAIVGVLFATRSEALFVAPEDLPASENTLDFAVVSNLSCLRLGDPTLDQGIDRSCAQLRREELRHKERLLAKITEAGRLGVMEELNRVLVKLPKSFSYELTEDSGAIELRPSCVAPLADWSKEEADRIETSGVVSRRRSYEVRIPRYRISQQISLDRYARLVATPAAERVAEVSYRIPELHVLFGSGSAQLETRLDPSDTARPQVSEIKLCE